MGRVHCQWLTVLDMRQGVAGFEDLLKVFGKHGGALSVLSWRRQGMQANQAHRFIAMYAIAQVRSRLLCSHASSSPILHLFTYCLYLMRSMSIPRILRMWSSQATNIPSPPYRTNSLLSCFCSSCDISAGHLSSTLGRQTLLLSNRDACPQGQEIDRNVVQQCTVSLTPLHHALISPRWPAFLQLLAMERAGAAKPPVRTPGMGAGTGIGVHNVCGHLEYEMACTLVNSVINVISAM